MIVNSDFYGGNIILAGVRANGDIALRLRADPVLGFTQWYYFVIEQYGEATDLVIENAGDSLIPSGWEGYASWVSEGGDSWARTTTSYSDGELKIHRKGKLGRCYYAYFPPYSEARLSALLRAVTADSDCLVTVLDTASESDEVNIVEFGHAPGNNPVIWILCRQHPGEVQASWWAEGFVRGLLDPGNVAGAALRHNARMQIVLNMNPDGSRLGNHRTNSRGVNLNASWAGPYTAATAPVGALLARMDELGIDMCVDVHADEELPYIFAARVDTLVRPSRRSEQVRRQFRSALSKADRHFYNGGGAVRPHTLSDPLSFCSPQIMKRYDVPAITLELPYKGVVIPGQVELPFGPEEAMESGRAAIVALTAIVGQLKS